MKPSLLQTIEDRQRDILTNRLFHQQPLCFAIFRHKRQPRLDRLLGCVATVQGSLLMSHRTAVPLICAKERASQLCTP